GGGLAHRLADHLAAAEHRLVAAAAAVLLHLDEQVGVGEPDPVPDGRPVERGVPAPIDPGAHEAASRSLASRSLAPRSLAPRSLAPRSSGPAHSPRSPRTTRSPASGTRSTSRAMPGSKRTAVPAGTASRCPQAAARSNASAGLTSAKW